MEEVGYVVDVGVKEKVEDTHVATMIDQIVKPGKGDGRRLVS